MIFFTQREYPTMALIEAKVIENELIINALQMPEIRCHLPESNQNSIQVQVWDYSGKASLVIPEVGEWLSNYLGVSCQLAYMPESAPRQIKLKYADEGQYTSFTDGCPFLLISEASLEDLNKRLEEPVSMDRFRPNLVVSGVDAYTEDTWESIQIGEVTLKVAKPCARCVMTTVNQEKGQVSGKEPLKTLSTYRKVDNKVLFGQNLIQLNHGIIKEGDEIEVKLKDK